MYGSHFHSFGSGRPWYGPRILVIGAFLLAGGTYDRFAAGATLQELFNGGSIIAGDSQISDWEIDLVELDSRCEARSVANRRRSAGQRSFESRLAVHRQRPVTDLRSRGHRFGV